MFSLSNYLKLQYLILSVPDEAIPEMCRVYVFIYEAYCVLRLMYS